MYIKLNRVKSRTDQVAQSHNLVDDMYHDTWATARITDMVQVNIRICILS